jgi:hypothetical protein
MRGMLANHTGTAAWMAWLAVLAVAVSPPSAFAQAWVPPGGVGVVSLVYQDIDNTGHRLTDGTMLNGYDSISRGVLLSVDYALTDRLSVAVGVPYIAAKYTGPEPSFFGLPIDDCLCWNRGWQDLGATVRYNIANDRIGLTPSLSIGVPTHDYQYFGEAVLGRNLKEWRVALDAGVRLDEISPRLSVSGRYSYAFVEKVMGLANDRSNMALETTYLLTRKLAARTGVSWQRSHGGLRSTEFTDELYDQFDRLLKDNNVHVTGGTSYSLPRFDVFAVYVQYVGGTDTHAGRALTLGVSWPFER